MTQQEFFNRYNYKPSTSKLGGGTFGKVYKAYDKVLDKYVAIKVAEQMETLGKIFSLMDEFKALENLPDHPNVAKYEQLYTFESPQGVFDYAIMQYYPDGNLDQLISNEKLTTEQKENLALQLLSGIGFLHQYKVVHRDLKPSNILIHNRTLDGKKEYIPKITDFGLSKKAQTDKNTRFTNSFAAGTYAYSSPEQLKGEELRLNTDLWAYGAIVYEIFTGKTMFNVENSSGSSAMDIKEILENIMRSDISSKIAELPEKWQSVVLACLERDPKNRAKSVDELKAILNGENTNISTQENTSAETVLLRQNDTKNNETQILEKEEKTQPQKPINKTKIYAIAGILCIALVSLLGYMLFPNTPQPQPKPRLGDDPSSLPPLSDSLKIATDSVAIVTDSIVAPIEVKATTVENEEKKEDINLLKAKTYPIKKLIGKHMFSLQWISWEKFGSAKIYEKDGKVYVEAIQKLNNDYVMLNGEIKVHDKNSFSVIGDLKTKVSHINNGEECYRNGKFNFENRGRYFRMLDMENPCDNVTDYVDIFIR